MSPAGARTGAIAFWSTRTFPDNPTGDQEIFVMNADGSGLRQVTQTRSTTAARPGRPTVTGLCSTAFPATTQADLLTVRVDGMGERNLTRSPGIVDLYPVWSPDGREIVFMRDDSGSEPDIATIRPDGSHLRALTDTPADEGSPDWSPDGKRIAFHSDAASPDEDFDVYVMRRDGGSPPTRLTTGGGYTPAWSPDGREIVFNNDELFTMRADGSRQKPVRPGFDGHHPDWQPVPKDARAEDDDD